MPSLCVFGAQWGDEGKGKIIDHLAADADYVVRYQGGSNAGHTVVVGDQKYVLHLVPSGVLHPSKVNVIGGGVALDPVKLLDELRGLAERGVAVGPESLRISARAHLILEHHRRLDLLSERWRGEGRIGTTGRGIGPCYADKASRTGLRMGDLLDAERLEHGLRAVLGEKNALLTQVHGEPPIDLDSQLALCTELGRELAAFVGDTGAELRRADAQGQTILFEAAQGVMLDLDHGTYPYVTSSNTGVDGIAAGAGFPPSRIGRAFGIAKAYCTRVGEGPFPTEDHGQRGLDLREAGNEYGATTGRPRRCGWLDLVALRYALEINGADGWVMTNLDVLSGLGDVPVGVAYRLGGRRFETFPAELSSLDGLEVDYETRPGWDEDLTGVRRWEDLPAAARDYVEWVEARVGCPILMLSIGPRRDQVIDRGLH